MPESINITEVQVDAKTGKIVSPSGRDARKTKEAEDDTKAKK